MLEIGITRIDMEDCGKDRNESCSGLSTLEARTHFGAVRSQSQMYGLRVVNFCSNTRLCVPQWCIVSSPLIIGFNFSDSAVVDKHWDTVTNADAIDVNQDWNGFSGSLFASSEDLITISPCTGRGAHSDPNSTECVFPATQSWYKPLSGRDNHHSVMAVLVGGILFASLVFADAAVTGICLCATYVSLS
jgi:hypothetical protein